MRDSGLYGSRYAKRFPPFVQGEHGFTVHRTRSVHIQFFRNGSTCTYVHFACSGRWGYITSHPVFHQSATQPGTKLCKNCFKR